MTLVVGLTGSNASGKGTVAARLADLGFAIHSLSDIVREEATRLGLPLEREHLIRVGNALRRAGGPGVLAQRIVPRLGPRDVVDSIRTPDEVTVLRGVPGFRLLGVKAPLELRLARAVERGRAGDPLTLEAFLAREREENSGDPYAQRLDSTFALADEVLDNGGTVADLRQGLDRLLAAWSAG